MLPEKITFVDIETTGGSVQKDRVIEIGIVRVESGKVVEEYDTLIYPECPVPPEIFKLTGIDKTALERAPTFSEVKDAILDKLKDSVFVAHNVRFDLGFLKTEFRRLEIKFSPKHFCTVRLSRSLFPGERRHNLDALISRFNIQCENRHRALGDAQVLWHFCEIVKNRFPSEVLEKTFNLLLRKPTIPSALPPKELEGLPEAPGVYIFYGQDGMPIYVGKSINIYERVLSHFSSDYLSSKEMSLTQQISHIEYIQTAGELGALLKESSLIKELKPLYNRNLRASISPVCLFRRKNASGYEVVEFGNSMDLNAENMSQVIGIYKSRKSAKEALEALRVEYGLCGVLLGLENGSSCFARRLGNCEGACCQEEKPVRYNLRFEEAFSHNSIKKWPFGNPIIISEEFEGLEDHFLIDKWCFLGKISEEGDITELKRGLRFDYDTYKILHRFLSKPSNLVFVKNLKNNSLLLEGTE